MKIKAAKGTRDILPGESEAWLRIERIARQTFVRYGYAEIRTPVFEPTELFHKSTGSDTDVVMKEMYTFLDRRERSLTLRPEGTPGVVRALIEAGWFAGSDLHRLYYVGPMFRYERPQKGRYRQFGQIGIEAFGSPHPALDVEVIQVAVDLFEALGIRTTLGVNSVGHAACRDAYRKLLREALMPDREALCPDCQRRLDVNPLRVLDCKVPSCQPIKNRAPVITDHLCEACEIHFAEVRRLLEKQRIPFTVDPRIVRGLDYYTRTTFELTGSRLGAQNAVCGGGRYDELVGSMGGPETPGIGFAIGEDRLVIETMETAAAGSGDAVWREGPMFISCISARICWMTS